MRLTIRLDPTGLRHWHLQLVERAARRPGTQVTVEWGKAADARPAGLALVWAMERLVNRIPAGGLADSRAPDDFARFLGAAQGKPDLVLDLSDDSPRAAEPTWHLTFDGRRGEAAAIGALTRGRTPVVAIVDAWSGTEVASGHPGTEDGRLLTTAFADVAARTITIVASALDRTGSLRVGERPAACVAQTRDVVRFAGRSLAIAGVGWVYRLLYRTPHWRTGWRFVDGADQFALGTHPSDGWRDLADDGLHFYADPFPLVEGGRTYLFVEDFDHLLERGVISAVEFDDRGPVGTPRPVLDTGFHLSYPFVFAHAGEVWMVPESCADATVSLYRATTFPDGWVKEATLLSGLVASDATLFEHDQRWWMLATVQDGGGSYSDALHVWSARDLRGPWQPHRRNPVLVDVAAARPAGRVVQRDGRLVRPVQDCRGGYGAALGLAEIVRLDDDEFEQRVLTIMRPGAAWPGHKLHTLNRSGRLECIDGSARAPRFRWLPSGARRARPTGPAHRPLARFSP